MQELESGKADDEMIIEAPPGLLPNLSEWGIEEVERGVCEDTVENRKVLRANKASWNVIFDQSGYPTGLIQAISADMYQQAQGYSKSTLLTDIDDLNSDYLSGLKLLMAEDAQMVAPTWVLRTTRTYMQQQEERRTLPASDVALLQSRLIAVPTRCTVVKSDGTRCWGWANGAKESLGMCGVHAKRATKTHTQSGMSVQQAARNRILSATAYAVDRLETLMDSEDEGIAIKAANSILDRGGLRGVIEVEQKTEVIVTDARTEVEKRIAKLRAGQVEKAKMMKAIREAQDADVVDAEVVE